MLGIKQEALAFDLGEDWNQRKVSLLEQKEVIDPETLQQLATLLKVPVEAIKNFDAEAAVSYINTFNDNSKGDFNYQCNFNPLDKYVEAVEKTERLYEALLKSEREKIALLEKMLQEKR